MFFKTCTYAAALRRMLIQDIAEYRRGVITEEYVSPEYRTMVEAEYFAARPLSGITTTIVERWVIWRTHYWRETGQRI